MGPGISPDVSAPLWSRHTELMASSGTGLSATVCCCQALIYGPPCRNSSAAHFTYLEAETRDSGYLDAYLALKRPSLCVILSQQRASPGLGAR